MKNYIYSMCIACVFVVVLLFSSATLANGRHYHSSYHHDILSDGEKMVVDAVVLRPIGLVTTVAGTAIYTISLPFSLLGGNEPEVRENLVKNPARYTFKRPLGEIEY